MNKKNIITTILVIAAILTTSALIYRHRCTAPVKTVLTPLVFVKGGSYEEVWKKVDSLEKHGLPKSALELVQQVYKNAKDEKNYAQIVKAVLHREKYTMMVEDEAVVKIIADLKTEISQAGFPLKPVLQSIMAETYWFYYQDNRWKFYNRSENTSCNPDDISTWDLNTLFKEIQFNFNRSLQNSDSLKRTALNLYDDIMVRDTASFSLKYRPTLYDFLAHRAVDFFMSSESELDKPANQFVLDGANYFKPAKEFAAFEIKTKDSLSLKYNAIKILQDLVSFHQDDDSLSAFVDADLKRLRFVYNNSVYPLKDSLYLQALKNLELRSLKHPVSLEVSHAIANVYVARAARYKPLVSDGNKWHLKTAYDYCARAIKRFPESYGAKICKYQQDIIAARQLQFTIESFNLPNKHFRALVSYKNIDTIFFRVIKIEKRDFKEKYRDLYGAELFKKYVSLKPEKEWSELMTNDWDFQLHTAEIKMPALPNGDYLILANTHKDFKVAENALFYAFTSMTGISYIKRAHEDMSYDFYVLNRETGEPMKNVAAILWKEEYDYTDHKYKHIKYRELASDNEGYFKIPATSNYNEYFNIEFISGNDKLYTDEYFYQYGPYYPYNKKQIRTFFFTDRSIYRPGQTIFFKGIMLQTDPDNNHRILPGYPTTVTFYDVNYQKIGQQKLTTNEYGTVSGSFTAPQGTLTGQMQITNEYGYAYFSVEEYKRPKFEVTFKPVEGSYRLNEMIKLTGLAKAYAGSNIDGAKVSYQVKRKTYYPYRWYWCDWYYPYNSQETILTTGTAATDEKGEFNVEFKALPDLNEPANLNPAFTFSIAADVTDINGETHSSAQSVNIGYTSLVISTNISQTLNRDTTRQVVIGSANLSGEFVPATCDITVYKLKPAPKLLHKRLWAQADRQNMTATEYAASFPYDIYKDDDNISKRERDKEVLSTTFETAKNKTFTVPGISKWEPGDYFIGITSRDKYGEKVSYEQYFTLFSAGEKAVPVSDFAWFTDVKSEGEPGESAAFLVGTKDNNVKVLYEVEHKDKIVKKEWLTLTNEQKLITIPLEEKHRGNVTTHFIFVRQNRCYSFDRTVRVPFTNKELDLTFSTFRDKLSPGEKEEWKIKIRGKKGEKVAAEMMATLYDASLDAFKLNYWNFNIYQSYYSRLNWYGENAFVTAASNQIENGWNKYQYYKAREYDRLNWFGFFFRNYYYSYGWMADERYEYDGDISGNAQRALGATSCAKTVATGDAPPPPPAEEANLREISNGEKNQRDQTVVTKCDAIKSLEQGVSFVPMGGDASGKGLRPVVPRTNFAETAFFFPTLNTNAEGDVIISFTIPEALTKWKMLGLAHTKDLKIGYIEKELVTQKELMVMPNIPRFLRENDAISLTAKVSNISDKDLSGVAELTLYDAVSMTPVDAKMSNVNTKKQFTAKKGQSTNLVWDIKVPEGIDALSYKITAQTDKFSDGEESTIPILTNRMLVTESLPLPIRSKQTKTFKFEKLLNSKSSATLHNHKLTLEFTANPAWYAVQALPYLIEYPYECIEQIFSRYYANSLASYIANSSPKIRKVFDAWKNTPASKEALLSNLEKNQELKSLMLEETPWVLESKDESARKRRIGLLFDLNVMSNNLNSALTKLEKLQVSNGAWTWFPGMPEDRYITQHIVTGFGHLMNLGVINTSSDYRVWNMASRGITYLDREIKKDHDWIKKNVDKKDWDKNHLGETEIQYLYMRSFFMDKQEISSSCKEGFDYYKGQAQKYWVDENKYMQGMIAVALKRFDDAETAKKIIASIKEHALYSDELGMYWKDNEGGYYWYQAPVETQALLIEAFDEVTNDSKSVEDMRVWLLKQKQTQDWKTTKATTDAIYALLLKGADWLTTESNIEITVGGQVIDPKKMPDVKVEAGTNYFKTSWMGSDIKPEMGNITVSKKDNGVSWGAMYWQYFEQLDKITPHATPLQLTKKLFVERLGDSGNKIEPLTEASKLKVGDKVMVHIELRVDRDMEYIHMKDMRASGFEPINVLSQYKYQDGLGYYESTRDVSTNFFISYLRKGSYVFEYPLRVTHNGDFSNGITTIQCMYAPEFGAHSEGMRVKVK